MLSKVLGVLLFILATLTTIPIVYMIILGLIIYFKEVFIALKVSKNVDRKAFLYSLYFLITGTLFIMVLILGIIYLLTLK